MKCKVSKFGGSSVATSEKIEQVAKIVQADSLRKCIVLSAPGKTPDISIKVTDLLIETAHKALAGADVADLVAELKQRFTAIYSPLGLQDKVIATVLSTLDDRVAANKANPEKYRDLLVASGEDLNARLFAEYLISLGLKADYVSPAEGGMVVTPVFGDAQPVPDIASRLAVLRDRCCDRVVVFPGFFGVTADGDIATFSRGGSDLTGALLAEALDASEYENWTDVDGIFSASPGTVDDPDQIPALTYREMRELSYIGFNVFHEEAVTPVTHKRIPIRLRNTHNLSNDGTLIVAERLPGERDVIGIASGGRYCSFTLQKYLMNREKGFGRKLLSIFENLDLSFEHLPTGVDNLSVVLDQTQLKPETVNMITRSIQREVNPDEIKIEFDISLVSVVGEGLVHKVGVLAQAATALADAEVNIKLLAQGSS
ncbi:MAG: aspartate kinase, partial [Chitinivibrionales bacterium]|nr:aspartate kinase [Chitinivibrionales bacterium]MBD3356203.1 aspartate kinase [Chitinivibrionales bacterium]